MSRINCCAERRRHKLPVPPEQRIKQPFVYDPHSGHLIAPWPKGRLSAEDEQRLDAVLDRLRRIAVDEVVWVWPDDRPPVEVKAASPHHWLVHWSRDHAVYAGR